MVALDKSPVFVEVSHALTLTEFAKAIRESTYDTQETRINGFPLLKIHASKLPFKHFLTLFLKPCGFSLHCFAASRFAGSRRWDCSALVPRWSILIECKEKYKVPAVTEYYDLHPHQPCTASRQFPNKKHGWAPVGTRAIANAYCPEKRSQRWSSNSLCEQ